MKSDKVKILLIDDTVYFGEELAEQLGALGFEVSYLSTPTGLDRVIRAFAPDLLFLDIDLGVGQSGIEICAELKSDHPTLPVILISSHTDAETREKGIRAGAMGFVGKPLTASLLQAYAHLYIDKKESCHTPADAVYVDLSCLGRLKVSFKRGLIFYPNNEVASISPIQCSILRAMMDRMGEEVTMDEIMENVWGRNSSVSSPASVYTAISMLRKLLRFDEGIRFRSVRGIGYRLDVES